MTGKKVGLVIGNNYPSSDKELKFAVADALAMKEVLLNKDICGFDEVEESIDETFLDARIKIEKLLKNANRDDLILIYFSGHGKKHLDNGLRLLFRDTKEDYPLATSLNFDYINRCMTYPSLKSVIIVLDCCYSGAAGIKGDDLEETLSNYSSGSGTVILTSTGLIGSPKAKEDTELKHGVFTKYLLEGLEDGSADEDEDGLIYVNDLYEYARSRTIKRSSQSPVMKTQIEGKLLIAKNPLKVKEKEFIRKKNKLVKNIRKELPASIYDISMIVLVDAYEKSEELTETDEEIRTSLEDLLEGKISVKTYIHTVQCYLENEEIEDSHILARFRNLDVSKIFKDEKTSKTFTYPSTGIEFILIPAGKFMMGSPLEEKDSYI